MLFPVFPRNSSAFQSVRTQIERVFAEERKRKCLCSDQTVPFGIFFAKRGERDFQRDKERENTSDV